MTTTVEKRHALLAAGWRRFDLPPGGGRCGVCKDQERWKPPDGPSLITLKSAWARHQKETKVSK